MRRQAGENTVAIVGAGPVGLTVAAALLRGGCAGELSVRVIDVAPAPLWDRAAMDLRVYALSRASQRILDSVGAWPAIAARRVSPYRRMHVWAGERFESAAAIHFDSADVDEPDLGHIVEDSLIREQLLGVVTAAGGQFKPNTSIRSVDPRPEAVQIELADGETIRASLLVAADGGRSRVRSMLHMPAVDRGYGQHALVTHVVTERAHEETAYQRFLAGGPLAFLPLRDGRSSVVWSLPSERAERVSRLPEAEFAEALQMASGGMLGRVGPVTRRGRFALRMLHATRYCARRVVLAGDAAHCVHPLAGQGMNLGLLDAACLVEELERARGDGQRFGDLPALRRYERCRKGENLQMQLAFDALERLFRLPGWIGPLRAWGLTSVDCMLPVKRALIRRALGPVTPLSGRRLAPSRGPASRSGAIPVQSTHITSGFVE